MALAVYRCTAAVAGGYFGVRLDHQPPLLPRQLANFKAADRSFRDGDRLASGGWIAKNIQALTGF